MVRKMAVAGSFYHDNPEVLKKQIEQFPRAEGDTIDVTGAVVPHAGLIYSGPVANIVYSKINIPETVVVLAPNHYGYGSPIALWTEGTWDTPFGQMQIDEELTAAILETSAYIEEDHLAHLNEHSIEVQLPFLKYYRDDVKLVPIVVGNGSLDILKNIGDELAHVLKGYGGRVMIIASSDMTHYESQTSAEGKDKKAIEKIAALDVDGLYDVVKEEHISMCGIMPTTIMLESTTNLGAKNAQLLRYQTSGDVTGDFNQVVGYAGIVVW